MRRRDFLKVGSAGALLANLHPKGLFSQSAEGVRGPATLSQEYLADEYPFPYDEDYFDCAERVFNVRRSAADPEKWLADVNLLLKSGKKLDIKILAASTLPRLSTTKDVYTFYGVEDSLDVELTAADTQRLYYQVQYREGTESWKALSPKSFKLPIFGLDEGGEINVLFIGDDHNFDDADYAVSDAYSDLKLSGDYVNDFIRGFKSGPTWIPTGDLAKLKNGFSLASTLYYIRTHEDPDFIVHLGDGPGIGARHKWSGFDLPVDDLTEEDLDFVARTFWLRFRKIYSIITPGIPMYLALGNHDGEPSWDGIRLKARDWRLKCFPLPDQTTYPEGGHPEGKYYAFSWASDLKNRGGAQFIVLDSTGFTGAQRPVTPQGWTLGEEQLRWLEGVLKKKETDWSFALFHHVLGGWPANSDGTSQLLAYGRGPLFSAQDYVGYGDPNSVEQVKITEMARQYGLRAFIYGHDHIYYHKKIGVGLNKRDLHALCVGSPKFVGESDWWRGDFWVKHYGDAFKEKPDFYGPVGITKMSIKKDGVTVKYIKSGVTTYTNMPVNSKAADTIATEIFSNPLPSLFVDKASLLFQSVEGEAGPPAQAIKVQNTGARALYYEMKSNQTWLSASPVAGATWGEVDEISISVNTQGMSEGSYAGALSVESAGVAGSPQVVSVNLKIAAPPIYAPLQFTAGRKLNKSLLSVEHIIILSWTANQLNRNITKYRLYVRDAAGAYVFYKEFDSGTLGTMIRKAQASTYYFAITAVDAKSREGDAAFTSAT